MELESFIAESIEQITNGLLSAQKLVSIHGVDIKTAGGDTGYSEIDFDVAVTTRKSKDLKGGGKLSVLGVGVDFGGGGDKTNTVASRIKFSVQFSIPQEEMMAAKKGGNNDNKA